MVGWLVISTAGDVIPVVASLYSVGHCMYITICNVCSTRLTASTLPNDNNSITLSN